MIQVQQLSKAFDGFPALTDLDLCVQKGSIYGLIGINGAGKTTILRLLSGVLIPDKGKILIDDAPIFDNEELKQRISLVQDDLYFPAGASLSDMGKFYRDSYVGWNEEKFNNLAALFALDQKKSIRSFSKGVKKQAAFILALSTSPDYLLLDEPIDGLDPVARKLVWKLIVDEVAEKQMTVLVSSHNLGEMESICDCVGIISDGKMRLEKELDAMKSKMNKVQVSFGDREFPEGLLDSLHILHRETKGSVELLIINERAGKIREVFEAEQPLLFDILPLTLEEIFIYEMGGENDDIKEILL